MSDGPQFSFLPAPRIPYTLLMDLPDPEWLDSLHPGGGDFIREWQAMYAAVVAAIDAVESGRPGGDAWGAAMAADARSVYAGETPEVWATEALLDGEHARWARASAEARTVSGRVQKLRASSPAAALAKAALEVFEALREPLASESEQAYRAAIAGDSSRGRAWTSYDSATRLAEDGARHAGLAAWLDARDNGYDSVGWGAPWSPESRGYYLSAGYALKPQEQPISMPQNVKWPDDINLPNVPIGARGQALRDAGFAEPGLSEKPIPAPGKAAAQLAEKMGGRPKASPLVY